MGKTIIINDRQLSLLCDFVKKNNQILAKHLPFTSNFKSKYGDWKTVWIRELGEKAWPANRQEMMSACHIVDIETRKVYLYPKTQSENAAIEGHEDDSIFIAEKSLLADFSLKDVDARNLDESPEELLNKALARISFL